MLTFKNDLKKGHDSEDADRRDSMTRLIFSSFCHADEKLYNKHFFPCQMARPDNVYFPSITMYMSNITLRLSNVFKLTSPSLSSLFNVLY